MSRAPTDTSSPVICLMSPAIRWAIGTPRLRTPTSARSARPRLCSRISCEIRVSARLMRSASITTGMFTSLRTRGSAFKETARSISEFSDLLEDHAAPGTRSERRIGAFARLSDQRLDGQGVEIGRRGNADVAHATARPLQQALRIGQRVSFEEIEIDPVPIDGNGVDDVRSALIRAEANHELVLLVVDELDRARQLGAKLGQHRARQLLHWGRQSRQDCHQ